MRAVELVGRAAEVVLPFGPGVVLLHVAVVVDALAQQCDGGADGRLRDRMGRVTHGVLHGDAPFGRGGQVDVVHSRGGHADQPQAGQAFERGTVERHLVGDDDVGVGRTGDDLFAPCGFVARIVPQRTDRRKVGLPEAVLVEKYDVRFHRNGSLCFLNAS